VPSGASWPAPLRRPLAACRPPSAPPPASKRSD
jgi:hypothetical protein